MSSSRDVRQKKSELLITKKWELYIAILGVVAAFSGATLGSYLNSYWDRESELRKSQENMYIAYVDALSDMIENHNNEESTKRYLRCRNKLIVVASKETICLIVDCEENAFGAPSEVQHPKIEKLLASIRKDLGLKDGVFSELTLKQYG